jgi:hypothetical protein
MADYISGSAAKYIINAQMVGGVTLDAYGKFTGFPGGQSGSAQSQLNPAIHNNSLISALNTIYDSASGNEPAGAASNIQYNLDGESFGASNNLVYNSTDGLYIGNDGGLSVSGSISGTLGSGKTFSLNDGTVNSVFKVTAAGVVTADGSITSDSTITGDSLTDGTATISSGAASGLTTVTASSTISGSAMSGLAGTLSSLNVQSGGITNAGAIAGATTVSGSGLASFGGGMKATGVVSGSGAGSFGSLTLDGAANLQSGGITNAGAIAGATTVTASGAVTGGSLTDGTATISSGAASGLTTIGSTGAATLDTGGTGSSFGGELEAGTLTDGTLSITGGAIASATTIGSTGAATLDTGANGSTFGGDLTVGGYFKVEKGAAFVDLTGSAFRKVVLQDPLKGAGGNMALGVSDQMVSGSLRIGNLYGVDPSCMISLAGATGSLTSSSGQSWNSQVGNWEFSQGCVKFAGNNDATSFDQIGPSFKLSSSAGADDLEFAIATGQYAAMPYFTMQGTDDTGGIKDYKLQVSGGVLKVSDYGYYG